jgi:DNA adenine methylase
VALNGGKSYLAARIVEITDSIPHLHYVEPFAGGLSVLLAKNPEGVSEVANDLYRHLTNFWTVIRHPHTFEAFFRVIEATPFSEFEWTVSAGILRNIGWKGVPDSSEITTQGTAACVLRACSFFICCRQSLAGRMKHFAPLSRNRTRRGQNEQASAWLTCIEGLPEVHARLKRVVILNHDGIDVCREQDGENTLLYLDPSYMPETRASTDDYQHEMTVEQHERLLEQLLRGKSKFILSGYRNDLYDRMLNKHTTQQEWTLPNNAASGESKRRMVETVWVRDH